MTLTPSNPQFFPVFCFTLFGSPLQDLSTSSHAVTSSLITRVYIIINIEGPPGLFGKGIRDFVASQMKGREVEGSVRRSLYGEEKLPSVTVKVSGSRATLDKVCTDLQSTHWRLSLLREEVYLSPDFIHRQFVVLTSERGAKSGPNSDTKKDYESLSSASSRRSGRSDTTGSSGK